MSDENQKPKPWDAVLGGQNLPKVYDAVLGGIKQITTNQTENISIENEKKSKKEDLTENKIKDTQDLCPDTNPSNSNIAEKVNPDNTKDNEALAGCGYLMTLIVLVS